MSSDYRSEIQASKRPKRTNSFKPFLGLCAFQTKFFVKSNASSFNFVSRTTRFWSLIFMLVRRHKFEGLVKHKNIINEFFSYPPILFIGNIICTKTHMHTKKGSLGLPRTLWVLTPSLCVTNPLTCDLWLLLVFIWKLNTFWFLFVIFPFSIGNNKSAVTTLVIWSLACQ